jgi:hypothetical protein
MRQTAHEFKYVYAPLKRACSSEPSGGPGGFRFLERCLRVVCQRRDKANQQVQLVTTPWLRWTAPQRGIECGAVAAQHGSRLVQPLNTLLGLPGGIDGPQRRACYADEPVRKRANGGEQRASSFRAQVRLGPRRLRVASVSAGRRVAWRRGAERRGRCAARDRSATPDRGGSRRRRRTLSSSSTMPPAGTALMSRDSGVPVAR